MATEQDARDPGRQQDPYSQSGSPPQGEYPPRSQYPPLDEYPPSGGRYPSRRGGPHGPRRDEKQDEKQGEKGQEKHQEKGRGMDEKYHRNPLGFVFFALFIIWLGITLLLQNADVIENGDRGWAIFFWGGGVMILVQALVRLGIPRFRRPLLGSFIWGAIWLGIGFGLWYDRWEVIGPIVIIAIGMAVLLGRLVPRR